MITVEQLNAIPGRPFPIGEWKQYIDPPSGEPGHFYTQDDMDANWQGNRIAILSSVQIDMSDVPVATALEIVCYAQRVESEVEKWKSQQSF